MPKINFQHTPRKNNKMFRVTSNCDTLIHRIKNFYFKYETYLSLEDKRRILMCVQLIDRANKVLDAKIRNDIYVMIRDIAKKYQEDLSR